MRTQPFSINPSPEPVFLNVRPGQLVIVQSEARPGGPSGDDWWMGQVLHCTGGARNPNNHNLFQIIDVDDGVIRWVNADLVSHILHSLDGLNEQEPSLDDCAGD